MTLAAHEEVVDAEIVRTRTEWAGIIKGNLGQAVEGIVSAGKNLTSAKADVNHTEWLPMLKEIGIDDSTARRLMSIAKNPAISNRGNCHDFPTAMRALYELSRMDPSDIEDGIESGRITPNMRIKDAQEFARGEWPEVPAPANVNPDTGEIIDEPTQEERVRKVEETHARLVREGIIPAPLTEEELEASAKEFVESLIGKTKRTPVEPVTPEDKFAKALNAVGAAIRINHGVNEAELNEDGWNVLRALGLR